MSLAKYRLSDVRASYGAILGVAVDELTIAAGGLYVLVGPNGSGKSTLLDILAFLNTPEQGVIAFDGTSVNWTRKECAFLRKRVTLLHQHPYIFSGSVARNVAFGPSARGASKEDTRAVVTESLERVGLAGFESRTARKLSGGESRRVALARALACRPDVLLLDEPLAHVDRSSAAIVESLVVSLAAGGMTIVLSSHDERLGARLGAEVIYLQDGKLAAAAEQLSSVSFASGGGGDHAHS